MGIDIILIEYPLNEQQQIRVKERDCPQNTHSPKLNTANEMQSFSKFPWDCNHIHYPRGLISIVQKHKKNGNSIKSILDAESSHGDCDFELCCNFSPLDNCGLCTHIYNLKMINY